MKHFSSIGADVYDRIRTSQVVENSRVICKTLSRFWFLSAPTVDNDQIIRVYQNH